VLGAGIAALIAAAGGLVVWRASAPARRAAPPAAARPTPAATTATPTSAEPAPAVTVAPPADRAAPPAVTAPAVAAPRPTRTADGRRIRLVVARLDGDVPTVTVLGVPLEGPAHAAPRLADVRPRLATSLGSAGQCGASEGGVDPGWTWPEAGVVLHQTWGHGCDPEAAVTAVTITPKREAWIVETSHGDVDLTGRSRDLPTDFQLWAAYRPGTPGGQWVMQAHARCAESAGVMADASAFALGVAVAKGAVRSATIELRCANPVAT
jgi:hypothetical protein